MLCVQMSILLKRIKYYAKELSLVELMKSRDFLALPAAHKYICLLPLNRNNNVLQQRALDKPETPRAETPKTQARLARLP